MTEKKRIYRIKNRIPITTNNVNIITNNEILVTERKGKIILQYRDHGDIIEATPSDERIYYYTASSGPNYGLLTQADLSKRLLYSGKLSNIAVCGFETVKIVDKSIQKTIEANPDKSLCFIVKPNTVFTVEGVWADIGNHNNLPFYIVLPNNENYNNKAVLCYSLGDPSYFGNQIESVIVSYEYMFNTPYEDIGKNIY